MLTESTSAPEKQALTSLTVRIPAELKEHLELVSEARGTSVTRVVYSVLEAHRRGIDVAGHDGQKLVEMSAHVARLTDLVSRQAEHIEQLEDALAAHVARSESMQVKLAEGISAIVAALTPPDSGVEVSANQLNLGDL